MLKQCHCKGMTESSEACHICFPLWRSGQWQFVCVCVIENKEKKKKRTLTCIEVCRELWFHLATFWDVRLRSRDYMQTYIHKYISCGIYSPVSLVYLYSTISQRQMMTAFKTTFFHTLPVRWKQLISECGDVWMLVINWRIKCYFMGWKKSSTSKTD